MTEESKIRMMEVCGTHTIAIAKSGIRKILPPYIDLISGPGCPVCVTSQEDIDRVLKIAYEFSPIVVSFGDMARVTGSKENLLNARKNGVDFRIIYSPIDSIAIAKDNPKKIILLFGVGFETTIPAFAYTLKVALSEGINNLKIYSSFKLITPAIRYILNSKELAINGFILPGHVSVILGEDPYEFIADEFHKSGVISGFEPNEIMSSISILEKLINDKTPKIINNYTKFVKKEGNEKAKKLIDSYFEPTSSVWRGIDLIKDSSLKLKDEFSAFDAETFFSLPPKLYIISNDKSCRCGEVLIGKIPPYKCHLFGKICNPDNPYGPCMVSQEGSCAAYYKYGGFSFE